MWGHPQLRYWKWVVKIIKLNHIAYMRSESERYPKINELKLTPYRSPRSNQVQWWPAKHVFD